MSITLFPARSIKAVGRYLAMLAVGLIGVGLLSAQPALGNATAPDSNTGGAPVCIGVVAQGAKARAFISLSPTTSTRIP